MPPIAGSGHSVRLDRLTVFSHLWGIAAMTEAARWMWNDVPRWMGSDTPSHWVLWPTSLALFAFPRSIVCLVAWALTQIGFHSLTPHTPWNHGLFITLMNAAILASVSRVYWRARRHGVAASREEICDHFAPVLRLGLILLYAFACFHKLNRDYLDPQVSCAGQVLTWLDTRYVSLPTGPWLTTVGIWSSLFAEGAVAVLLCFRRTIGLGLVIGIGFHLFLSQFGGLYGFAAAMYAVYYLFLPATFTDELAVRREEILRRLHLDRVQAWISPGLVIAILTSGLVLNVVLGVSALGVGLLWWDAWVIVVAGCFIREFVRALRTTPQTTLVPPWRPMWAIPLLVGFIGFSPYLGLKTETSWSMYSNLRTEAPSNHLLMPGSLKVAGYQDDLVEIVETSLPELKRYRDDNLAMTFFEFRRLSSRTTADFRVVYKRNGSVHVLESANGVSSDPLVTRPHGWLTERLLAFRPVEATGRTRCRH
jgi:hypothetical protein